MLFCWVIGVANLYEQWHYLGLFVLLLGQELGTLVVCFSVACTPYLEVQKVLKYGSMYGYETFIEEVNVIGL